MFQPVMLKSASTQSRNHWPRGEAMRWPPARSTAKSTSEPIPRQSERKVQGGTSASASFIAIQLKPQASVSAPSSHQSRAGR